MRRTVGFRTAIAVTVVLSYAGAAFAATLSCTEFKVRIDGALLATGVQDTDAMTYELGFTNPSRGSRFSWRGNALSGTLACGVADQFEEFGVTLTFSKKDDVAAELKHFIAVSGASMCAVSSENAPACGDFARRMLQEGLEQMGQAFNHGSKTPAGISDRTILPGVNAELTSAPTLLTFLLGGSVDASRQPLTPQPSKPAE